MPSAKPKAFFVQLKSITKSGPELSSLSEEPFPKSSKVISEPEEEVSPEGSEVSGGSEGAGGSEGVKLLSPLVDWVP